MTSTGIGRFFVSSFSPSCFSRASNSERAPLGSDAGDEVAQIRIVEGEVFFGEHDLAEHAAVAAQPLGQRARVDAGEAGDLLLMQPLRQAFLQGYRRVRPLPVSHEALLDTFIAARLMCHVLWLAAHVDEPSYGLRAVRRIEYEIGELKGFLEPAG